VVDIRAFAAAALLVLAACSAPVATQTPSARPTARTSVTPSPAGSLTPAPTPTAPPASGTTLSLAAIQRLNPGVGYLAAWNGGPGLAKTGDGGATWQRIAIPASYLTALRFIDERVGWVGGFRNRNIQQVSCAQAAPAGATSCAGVVLRTGDGGQTWQEALSIPTDGVEGGPIRQLQAVDGQRAWVVTLAPPCGLAIQCPADLRRTTDGGRTWQTLLHGGILGIRFASAYRGWVALADANGAVEVRMTSDGGTTWAHSFRATGNAFALLDAATIYRAWVMTRDGSYCTSSNCAKYELFRTDDGGMSWSSLGNPKDLVVPPCAFGHLSMPLFASPVRGWLTLNLGAGGANGVGGLLSSEDGGRSWRCSTTPPNTSLVSAADPTHVWVSSDNRSTGETTIYDSGDGGRTWRPLDLRALR
jgi:photosystem II stability/assembly factor-like uncharacterized protein